MTLIFLLSWSFHQQTTLKKIKKILTLEMQIIYYCLVFILQWCPEDHGGFWASGTASPACCPYDSIMVLGRIWETGTILNNAPSSHHLMLFLQLPWGSSYGFWGKNSLQWFQALLGTPLESCSDQGVSCACAVWAHLPARILQCTCVRSLGQLRWRARQ